MTDTLARDLDLGGITAHRIREMWKDGMHDTREQRRLYWIAHEFLRGNQWLTWDAHNERLTPLPQDDVIRHTNNRLGPATRTIMAKLHRRPLAFEVPLSASDDGSVQGSKLAQAVLGHTAREQDWERVRRKADRLAWKGGTSLICVEWDTNAAGVLGVNPATNEEVGRGDISLSALSITEACTEPGCDDIEHAPWWIKCVSLPPKTVQRIYGLADPPQASATDAATYDVRSPWGRDGLRANLATVLTYFERPSKKNPEGLVMCITGDTVLHEGPWPYPFTDRLNVVCITETEQEGRWNGDSVLWDAIPLQAELNRAHTNISEHNAKVGFAQRMFPQGTIDGDLSDDPADIIEYVPGLGGTPGYLTPPDMPAWVVQRADSLKRDIDDVLGVHDISRGLAPAGVEAGIALQQLAENDDTPIGGFSTIIGAAWGKVASEVLECYAAFVRGERRKALVRHDSSAPEPVEWDGRMLAGQTFAEVSKSSTDTTGELGHQVRAMNLWDRGVFVTPDGKPDTEKFLAYANLSGTTDALEEVNPALVKYRRQNAQMFAGVPCPADTFDDHALAIREINRARFSRRYEEAPEEIKELFDLKAQSHQRLSEEEMTMQNARSVMAPHLAVAAHADEPPLAGEPETLANLQAGPPEQMTRGPAVGGGDAPFAPDMSPAQ